MRTDSALIHTVRRLTPILLRLALGAAFLSAVGDRFGLWGPLGTPDVAWGNFQRFMQYTAQLNPWAPAALVPALAWTASAAELALGVALVAGLFTREAALASGLLLLLFALGMTVGTGVKSALDASVLSAAAGAFGLTLLGPGFWSLDELRGREAST